MTVTEPYTPGFTHFDIPIHRDKFGGMTVKAVVVSDALLPVMADIIEKATRPVLLTKEQTVRVDPMMMMTEKSLEYIRKSAARELRWHLEEKARGGGMTLITEPRLDESTAGGMLAFRCTATAMPLLVRGLES